MELRLSNLAKTYPASGIRKMFDLAAGYDDVIALTLGEPNFETPAYIKEAAKKALDENYTHYAPNAGLPVLREAIAKRYQKSHWAGYKAENVIVTVGALEGLTLGMLALLNPGDEILVPDPGFANYYGQAKIVGAVPVPVPAHEENGFNMTAADIEKCITPKTKAIIVNSPCNPTGAVMSEADVRAIAEVVKKQIGSVLKGISGRYRSGSATWRGIRSPHRSKVVSPNLSGVRSERHNYCLMSQDSAWLPLSVISFRAVMRRVTTVTNGRKFSMPTLSRFSGSGVFSIRTWRKHSGRIFWKREAQSIR